MGLDANSMNGLALFIGVATDQAYNPLTQRPTASINMRQVFLKGDESIEIHHVNPLFDRSAGGSFSYSFTLDCEANRHIFGNCDELRGASIYKVLYGRPFTLYMDGRLLLQGVVHMDSEVEVEDGTIEIELASANKEFNDILDGVNAQDVLIYQPELSNDEIRLLDEQEEKEYEKRRAANLQIGLCTSELSDLPKFSVDKENLTIGCGLHLVSIQSDYSFQNFQLPRFFVVKYGGLTFANTSKGYPTYKYCNTRICSQKYVENNGNWEKKRGYFVGEADRINSAPNFFVLYWLDKMMESLGIRIASNALSRNSTICKLAFFNPAPQYEAEEYVCNVDAPTSVTDVMSSVGKFQMDITLDIGRQRKYPFVDSKKKPATSFWVQLSKHKSYTYKGVKLFQAFATGKNFPDTDASSIINALQDLFCCRFIYDATNKSIDIVMLKDVLEDDETVVINSAIISDMHKKENHINGFRLKYSAQPDRKKNNITKKEELTGETDKSEDTTFAYNDYRKAILFNSRSGGYTSLINNISPADMNCYVDNITGNQFRVKVDKDAENTSTLFPSLFEVLQFGGVEYGDCSNEEFIEEVSIGFTPILPNDVNFENEKNLGITEQMPAQLLDIEMRASDDPSKGIEQKVTYDVPMIVELAGKYTYHPDYQTMLNKYTDNGLTPFSATATIRVMSDILWDLASDEAPIYKEKPEMNIGLFCPANVSGDQVDIYEENYDGQGNGKFRWEASTQGALVSDNVDAFGSHYDGLDFSLRISGEKPNPYYAPDLDLEDVFSPNGQPWPNKKYFPVDSSCARRGIAAKFYDTYAYWVLNRKIAIFDIAEMDINELEAIDMTRKYEIGGIVGFIKEYSYTLSNKDGLCDIHIELYYL